MKRGPNKVRALILATCVAMVPQLGQSIFAQSGTDTTTTVHKKSRKSPSIEQQMQQMQQQFQQQQEEINQLRQQLLSRDQQLQQAQDSAQQAQAAAQQAQSQLQAQQNNHQNNEAYTTCIKRCRTSRPRPSRRSRLRRWQSRTRRNWLRRSPIRMTSTTRELRSLLKGSFLAAETDWRSGATGGGLNTAFTAMPLQYSPAAQMSEFDGTGRQSRIAIKATGKLSS